MNNMLFDSEPQLIEFEYLDADESSITAYDWRISPVKGNTRGQAVCDCGSWKAHWINYANKAWPATCSVKGCNNAAEHAAHIINLDVRDIRIVPMCTGCSELEGNFDLSGGVSLPSASDTDKCGNRTVA